MAALARTGAIAASNAGDLKKIGWSRSSRTDKGVHALAGVVALKFECHPDHDFAADPEGLTLARVLPAAAAAPPPPHPLASQSRSNMSGRLPPSYPLPTGCRPICLCARQQQQLCGPAR